jgi:hypothetical protein
MRRMIQLFIFVYFSLSTVLASGFEGKIEVVKKSFYDSTFYSYMVKDNHIRIDEFNAKNELINSYIIDTKTNSVYALNCNKKIYKQIEPSENVINNKDFEIIKTENTKIINGYLCYQWRVRNREKNSEIAYWVTKDGFHFYNDMLRIINNIGNLSDFFIQIPDTKGYLPIMAVERTLVRYEKFRLQVKSIEPGTLSANVFSIPKDYKLIDD